ncbi:conserved hypothetical protein [Histoplasma capsulatum var. duboisii H88]|uniref:Uncharacterized protein n=1 Tax=Ajellomyces capsulatus (strain H88) TaxID=544711 RepID=F0UFY6_AJEC8|nr:conserved hypothetical protein [Histoplasma capsulatum var. duboisii H88]
MFKMDTFPTKPKKRYFPHGLSGCALFSTTLFAIISLWGAYLIGSSRYHLGNGNMGKTLIPTLPLLKEPVVFNPDPRWSGSDPETHKLWEKEHLNGFTHSFVLDNPRDYGLEKGVPARRGGERFGISMYHQLHCLYMPSTSHRQAFEWSISIKQTTINIDGMRILGTWNCETTSTLIIALII